LGQPLFSNRQRLYQNGNVTHFPGNGIHVLFVVNNELRHEPVPFFNTPFLKFSGETKILTVRAACGAIIMITRSPDHWHNEVSCFHARDFRTYFNDFAQ